jgi:hypothetical protein
MPQAQSRPDRAYYPGKKFAVEAKDTPSSANTPASGEGKKNLFDL